MQTDETNQAAAGGPLERRVRPLLERLRGGVYGTNRIALCAEAADELERMYIALRTVRAYPDFDDGGPLPEMIDQVLRGEPAPLLEKMAEWERTYGSAA